MKNKVITLLFALFASIVSYGQNFSVSSSGGSLANHTICGGTGCIVDARISTTTTTGFDSPSIITNTHFQGRDFADYNLGDVDFSTGSFQAGDLAGTALYKADGSYVRMSANGRCGIYRPDGLCRSYGFVPNTNTFFIGVFEGLVTWQTLADKSHIIKGTVKGIINGKGGAVYLSFTATTEPDAAPFTRNGHLDIATINLRAFDAEGN